MLFRCDNVTGSRESTYVGAKTVKKCIQNYIINNKFKISDV